MDISDFGLLMTAVDTPSFSSSACSPSPHLQHCLQIKLHCHYHRHCICSRCRLLAQSSMLASFSSILVTFFILIAIVLLYITVSIVFKVLSSSIFLILPMSYASLSSFSPSSYQAALSFASPLPLLFSKSALDIVFNAS